VDESIVPLYDEGEQSPLSEVEHAERLRTALDWFDASDRKRQAHVDRWRDCYRLYRSWAGPRKKGDWRPRIFIPISFHIVETEMPKLVAQLPSPIVLPVGPEDIEAAAHMEERLSWAFDQCDLYVQLQATYRSALKYGTGVLKVYPGRRDGWRMGQEPIFTETTREFLEPVLGPAGEQMLDLDGVALTETRTETEQVPTGEMRQVRERFTYYQGPFAEAIDIEDFWPAPEASSISDARYVLHRVWRDESYIRDKLSDGTYRLPAGMELGDLWEREDSPAMARQGEVGLSQEPDPNRQAVEVWEFWTDDELMTVLNRRLVVRVAPNPFSHGQKPFVRVLDHFQEHEFWGVGELEPIIGIQDAINQLWNSRIENVRLVLQRVFVVNPANLYDLRDLRFGPGTAIRVQGDDADPRKVIYPLDMPDVTSSAYAEVQALIDMVERVLAVSAYQAGTDSPTLNQTATGVALITEQGNSRFALKVKMGELTGVVPLTRQFAGLLQQFSPAELIVRREGAEGGYEFTQLRAEDIAGAFDFDIETGSSAQTESIRKEQAAGLFNMLAGRTDAQGLPLVNDRELLKDLLRAWGKKDVDRILIDPEAMMAQQQPMGEPGMLPGMEPPPSVEETAEQGAML